MSRRAGVMAVLAFVLVPLMAGSASAGVAKAPPMRPAGGYETVPSPLPGESRSNLYSVSCVSAKNCFAVGDQHEGFNGPSPLVEHWDGTSWTIQTIPNGDNLGGLTGVSCLSAKFCMAVGTYAAGRTQTGVYATWNGSSWSALNFVSIAQVPGQNDVGTNLLTSVSCVSRTDCWAVGSRYQPTATIMGDQTLAVHWDGTTWTSVPAPDPGDPTPRLPARTVRSVLRQRQGVRSRGRGGQPAPTPNGGTAPPGRCRPSPHRRPAGPTPISSACPARAPGPVRQLASPPPSVDKTHPRIPGRSDGTAAPGLRSPPRTWTAAERSTSCSA